METTSDQKNILIKANSYHKQNYASMQKLNSKEKISNQNGDYTTEQYA